MAYELICCEKQKGYGIYYGSGCMEQPEEHGHLHYDGDLTLTCFLRCSGTVRIEGNAYPIADGDIIIMNPREIHYRRIDKGSSLELISIHVNRSLTEAFPFDTEQLFDRFDRRMGGVGNRISAKTAERHGLDTLISAILAAAREQTDVGRILTVCKLTELLIRLTKLPAAAPVSFSGETSGNTTVDAALRYIAAHYREDISCRQIAEELYVSRYRLEHLFKEVVGVPLWEYVILRRIICFHELVGRQISVSDAAYRSGFRNYANFYRLYKKRMNQTPAEYKRKLEETNRGGSESAPEPEGLRIGKTPKAP